MNTQSTSGSKIKHCDFTFALSNIEQAQDIISSLPDFDIWAYIKHLPDDENGSDHYHFYIHNNQPFTIKSISEKLDIPQNMIEWVRVKTKLIQYLVHKNQPEKIQYNDDQIITNNREYINRFLNPVSKRVDIYFEFKSLNDVASGHITPFKYLELHSDSISSLPFYSRFMFLSRLTNIARLGYKENIERIKDTDPYYKNQF